ncbi:MAG: PorT family protein [Bacteroidales bacterium]|nr:PorT family protein [Bacteroidales bacterium]
MKKVLILLVMLASGVLLRAQTDSLMYTPEYLDTVNVKRVTTINDYHMIGVNYGVTFSTVYFNPTKMGTAFRFQPTYFSVMYTHHEKMFNYIPYFGITAGVSYSHSGVQFEMDPQDGYPLGYVDGATDVTIETVEVPVMMQMHFDSAPFKILANLGGYAGYRLSIERSGVWMDEEYANKFRDYEYRFDYGLTGGAGLGFMFDPVEIHFNILGRWSLQNLYEPDYYNETFHPYNTYYYRYANPIDIALTVGVYLQLTKRTGKTTKQIKKEARDIVYGTFEND